MPFQKERESPPFVLQDNVARKVLDLRRKLSQPGSGAKRKTEGELPHSPAGGPPADQDSL